MTAKEIETSRDGYRPAAKRGAVLFFCLSDMANINSMYQYSLISYLDVFNYSLKKSMPDTHLIKRLKNIIDTLTLNVYHYACTGNWTQLDICDWLHYSPNIVYDDYKVYVSEWAINAYAHTPIHIHTHTHTKHRKN